MKSQQAVTISGLAPEPSDEGSAAFRGEPCLLEVVIDALADQNIDRKAVLRLAQKSSAIEVDIADL
jgi:hypothetical protein